MHLYRAPETPCGGVRLPVEGLDRSGIDPLISASRIDSRQSLSKVSGSAGSSLEI